MALTLDPAALPSGIANRLLGREAWARERLAVHAGRVFSIGVGPLVAGFRIGDGGELLPSPASGPAPDLALTLSPFALPSFLADPGRWDELVKPQGDAALAATLKELAQTLPWFVEQAFGQAFGKIAGQRMADTGRHLLTLPGYASERVGESITRYARDEARWLAQGDEFAKLADETRDVATRTDALAARLDALAERLPAAPHLRSVR